MKTSSSKKSKHQTNKFYTKKLLEEKKVRNKFFSKYSNNYIKCNFKRFQYNLCLII